jgi:hypothetical protein
MTNEAEFYRPAVHAAARRTEARNQAARAVARERWCVIWDMLGDLGMTRVPIENQTLRQARGHPVTVELADWERLLGIGD